DRKIGALAPHARARQGLGFVPQGRQIFPALSVAENLRMGCVKNLRGADAMIASVLKVFPRLQRLLDRPGGSLSGGERARLLLARLFARPRQRAGAGRAHQRPGHRNAGTAGRAAAGICRHRAAGQP
ncbi:hypothetical protein CTI14_16975, partial [Methylobacterium radiotolerans]